jgi:tetratricopeptide (TPR) repeat protein
MFFFFIPFGIFLASVLLIVWVIARKFVYLKKLAPEVITNTAAAQKSFWAELFPELVVSFKKIKFREWKIAILAEFEKFLRKVRLIFLKVEAVTNQLIHKIRRTTVYQEEVLNQESRQEVEVEEKKESLTVSTEKNGDTVRDWKEEEQELIMEIAKNPKNADLYKKLGNLYLEAGEWIDASESFKKALELDPEDTSVKMKLERVSKKTA